MDFLVKRDDPRSFEFVDGPVAALGDDQSLLEVERFSLTANNITYALFGDAMVFPASESSPERSLPSYWSFFPADRGWGRIPVWGFARVVQSNADALSEGSRVYGYLPPSSHLVVTPGAAGRWGFLDSSPHRAPLPGVYNAYLFTGSDPLYDAAREDQLALLRTLFVTSFLIDDYLADGRFFGAETVVLSSASSKTALAAAFLLAQRDGLDVVGLTSRGNLGFVEGTGVYDGVVDYQELDSLILAPAVYVDFSGDAKLRADLHRRYGKGLVRSLSVGAAHWERVGHSTPRGRNGAAASGSATLLFDPEEVPGPRPEFFFAGDRIVARTTDWGARGLWVRIAEAWRPYLEWTDEWLELVRGNGPAAIESAYRQLIEGRVDPAVGFVLTPESS